MTKSNAALGRFLPVRAMKTARALAVLLTLSSVGCSPDVAKLREEQDARLKTESADAVLADYKAKYVAKPNDAARTYLYARLVKDAAEKASLGEKLLKDHPKFPWSHYFAMAELRERGDFVSAEAERQEALKLEPSNAVFKAAAITGTIVSRRTNGGLSRQGARESQSARMASPTLTFWRTPSTESERSAMVPSILRRIGQPIAMS
jgi:hypothetical protein